MGKTIVHVVVVILHVLQLHCVLVSTQLVSAKMPIHAMKTEILAVYVVQLMYFYVHQYNSACIKTTIQAFA